MKRVKKVLISIVLFSLFIAILFSCNVIWKSPSFYDVKENRELITQIMDMEAYKEIWQSHRRPYCYSIRSKSKGEVHILGVEHITDPNHSQFDTIRNLWNRTNPTVAFVEGRLGFLFTWFIKFKILDNSEKVEKEYVIKNTNRAVGTRISHQLYKKYGYEKLDENFLTLNFRGSAGQSFGAFGAKGLKLVLKGDANDYVGKGLSGGRIIIYPPLRENILGFFSKKVEVFEHASTFFIS